MVGRPCGSYADSSQAIERTFRGVSKSFASVFSELVPAGRGRLIIQRKTDKATAQGDGDSEDEQARRSVESYTGVGISVSFNSKHDEQQRIQQLSGGQKSKFLFIISYCDPYLSTFSYHLQILTILPVSQI